MNISKDVKSIGSLRSRAAEIIEQVNETHRPIVIIQKGEPRAVLQDLESYENMRNAIGILKLISQGERDFEDGRSKAQKEVFANVQRLLKRRMK